VNYVYAPYDPSAVAMANAINQAGLGDRVKLISIVGAAQNIDMIRKGFVQAADGAFDNDYMGYAMVDQAIRVLNGQPVIEPNDEGTPYIVIDKTNLPPEGKEWATKTDYKSAYMKLWQ
jgi:ABC-type sugar transport system substrate-binding protein